MRVWHTAQKSQTFGLIVIVRTAYTQIFATESYIFQCSSKVITKQKEEIV